MPTVEFLGSVPLHDSEVTDCIGFTQVTLDNFADAFNQFERLLPSCKFIAFDEEMTGIAMSGTSPNVEDDPEARYLKMKRVTEEFTLMQVGICLFHESDGSKGAALASDEAPSKQPELVATPFNFYVFPDSKSGGRIVMYANTVHAAAERAQLSTWELSSSSGAQAAFHRENKMDFNKWISRGVPYLRHQQFDNLMAEAISPASQSEDKPKIALSRKERHHHTTTARPACSGRVRSSCS